MNKAIFLDRDGTINIDKSYVYQLRDFEYIDKTIEALRMLQDSGYKLIIITNQSGIARGIFSEEALNKLNFWMLKDLEKRGIYILSLYYCPHLKEGIVPKYSIECTCRKPHTGFFRRAIKDHNIDVNSSYAIGDKLSDINVCTETAIKGILLENGHLNQSQKNMAKYEGRFYIKDDLFDAANFIIKGQTDGRKI